MRGSANCASHSGGFQKGSCGAERFCPELLQRACWSRLSKLWQVVCVRERDAYLRGLRFGKPSEGQLWKPGIPVRRIPVLPVGVPGRIDRRALAVQQLGRRPLQHLRGNRSHGVPAIRERPRSCSCKSVRRSSLLRRPGSERSGYLMMQHFLQGFLR